MVLKETYLHAIKCFLHFIINYSLMAVTSVGGFSCSARPESHLGPQSPGAHPSSPQPSAFLGLGRRWTLPL